MTARRLKNGVVLYSNPDTLRVNRIQHVFEETNESDYDTDSLNDFIKAVITYLDSIYSVSGYQFLLYYNFKPDSLREKFNQPTEEISPVVITSDSVDKKVDAMSLARAFISSESEYLRKVLFQVPRMEEIIESNMDLMDRIITEEGTTPNCVKEFLAFAVLSTIELYNVFPLDYEANRNAQDVTLIRKNLASATYKVMSKLYNAEDTVIANEIAKHLLRIKAHNWGYSKPPNFYASIDKKQFLLLRPDSRVADVPYLGRKRLLFNSAFLDALPHVKLRDPQKRDYTEVVRIQKAWLATRDRLDEEIQLCNEDIANIEINHDSTLASMQQVQALLKATISMPLAEEDQKNVAKQKEGLERSWREKKEKLPAILANLLQQREKHRRLLKELKASDRELKTIIRIKGMDIGGRKSDE